MDSDAMEILFFLLAAVAVWVFAAFSMGSRTRIKRLEARVTELGGLANRHATAGTVLYERIEALRTRLEATEAQLAVLKASPSGSQALPAQVGGADQPATPAPTKAEATDEAAIASPVVAPPEAGEPASPPAVVAAPRIAETPAEPIETTPRAPAEAGVLPLPTGADAVAPTAASPVDTPSVTEGAPRTEATSSEASAPVPPTATAPAIDAASPPALEAAAATAESPAVPAEQVPPQSEPEPPRAFDWESLVGVRLFSGIAGIAFVLAAVFFLRYSITEGYLTPPIRLAIGIVGGVALLVVSETRGRSTWNVTANALGAAGIAILFASFFAANALWHLIPPTATFALMVLVTAVAVLLAIRHDSVFIALLGLVGGFSTPILLSTGEDRPIGLFGYLLVLNVGLAWVGRRRGWTVLIALSVGFTALYQWGWVMKFLVHDPAELPIAVAVFLVFPLLIAVSRLVPADSSKAGATPPAVQSREFFENTATISSLLPLLFAIFFAWVPTFGEHYLLLFGYLLVLDIALAVIAVTSRQRLLHSGAALATLVVFARWISSVYGTYAWPAVLGLVSLFVLFFLLAPFASRRIAARLATTDSTSPVDLAPARITAPLLLFTFPVLVYLEKETASPLLVFGVMFVLLAAIAAVAVLENAGALYFLAAFFAVVAEAVWSSQYLTPERLQPALLLYGAFGIFHLSVPLIARRFARRLEPDFAPPVLLIASLALLLFLAGGPVAHIALWGMALLLAILNLGLFFDPRPGRVTWLAAFGMMLSWVVIAVWWATAMVAALLLPALAIVGGFAVLLVGGNLWAERQLGEGAASNKSVYLGLVGHLFLLFVASQESLAAPPWPLLGVLFVLDLAILVAALYAKRAELFLSAIAASQFVWCVWVITTHDLSSPMLPWTEVGVLATLGVAAMALGALWLAKRRGAEHVLFPWTAAVALLGADLVIAVAGGTSAAPPIAWLVVPTAMVLLALAWLAREMRRFWLMLLPLWLYLVGTTAWIIGSGAEKAHLWGQVFVVAAVPYVLWLAYPVWLGASLGVRARALRSPYVGAVLASGIFFLFGYDAMGIADFKAYIGILPIVQSALLMGLVLHLLRMPAPPREGDPASTDVAKPADDTARLALVAGAALSFVTVAIPLQLDKQWITIGWGLEAAALAWLYRRVVHKGLLATSAGLAVAVVLRLSLNRAVFSYHPRGAVAIWNWYLYAYLVSAVALLVAGWLLSDVDDRFERFPSLPRVSSTVRAGATLLLFLLVNIEIADYWSSGSEITFNFSSGIAQDLTYTLGWAIFAIALLTVGIVRQGRAARLAALFLLVVTIAKAFLHDLWRLGGLYRVGSFVGLAVSLALVAIVLQRFVLPPAPKKKT